MYVQVCSRPEQYQYLEWDGIYIVFVVYHQAILPEWSKGVDLRSTIRTYAWVQTPQMAFFFHENANSAFWAVHFIKYSGVYVCIIIAYSGI